MHVAVEEEGQQDQDQEHLHHHHLEVQAAVEEGHILVSSFDILIHIFHSLISSIVSDKHERECFIAFKPKLL